MTTATVTPIARKRTTRAAAKPAADDKPSLTAEQINAQTTASRLAAAKGQGSSAKSVTGSNAKPAGSTPAKPTTPAKGKPAAAAKGKPAAAKAAAPKTNANKVIGSALITAGADLVASWVPADHEGITKAAAAEAIGRWLAYLPSSAEWDKRLGTRSDAGRRRPA